MKVLFLQTAHPENDDRIYYHQRVSLEKAGHKCAFADSVKEVKDIPQVVICDTPKAIWETHKTFKKSIIVYDVTEWYPSKKNLRNISRWLKPIKWCALVIASIYAGLVADAFIFGEYYKARPFRFLFPWKRHLHLSYYPSLNYIQPTTPHDLSKEVRLFYAGPKTAEKGYERVQEVAKLCQKQMPDRRFVLTIVNGLTFEDFCQEIAKHDIFLDLRDNDIENTHCLPIKLFYYMAAGRPVIYSDLKAIHRGVPEIVNDSLVKPYDIAYIVNMVCNYVSHPEHNRQIGKRNRNLIEQKYNWEIQSDNFVQFITRSSKNLRTGELTT